MGTPIKGDVGSVSALATWLRGTLATEVDAAIDQVYKAGLTVTKEGTSKLHLQATALANDTMVARWAQKKAEKLDLREKSIISRR